MKLLPLLFANGDFFCGEKRLHLLSYFFYHLLFIYFLLMRVKAKALKMLSSFHCGSRRFLRFVSSPFTQDEQFATYALSGLGGASRAGRGRCRTDVTLEHNTFMLRCSLLTLQVATKDECFQNKSLFMYPLFDSFLKRKEKQFNTNTNVLRSGMKKMKRSKGA